MHLLPCPHCEKALSVSPSKAGEETSCPHCGGSLLIPKLGELKQLPLDEESSSGDAASRSAPAEGSSLAKGVFAVAGLVAAASLLVAAFCGLRWALVEVPATTDDHVSVIRQELAERSAAELVREYEDMEKRGLDLGVPFKYKEIADLKSAWGRNAIIAGAIGVGSLLLAIFCATSGRGKPA